MKKNLLVYLKVVLLFTLFFIAIHKPLQARVITKQVLFNQGKITVKTRGCRITRPKIGLVLSGGGSHGMLHIGVLKALEENHITIDLIVGSSIGSVIGGLYAAGYSPQQLARIVKRVDWKDIYRDETQRTALYVGQKKERDRYLVTIRFKNGNPYIPLAFSPGQKIQNILSDLVLRARYQARNNFDNLRIPFRAVATDLISGKRVALRSGNLAESINASLALPLLFTPIERDSMLLVDGGMRSNLPVDVAKQAGMDLVIAVDASSGLRSKKEITAPWEIVDQATTIMTALPKQQEEKRADLLIKPDLTNLLNNDFSKTDSLIALGETLTLRKIPYLKALSVLRDSVLNERYVPRQIKILNGAIKQNPKILPPAGRVTDLREVLTDLQKWIRLGYYRKVSARLDSSVFFFRLYPFALLRKIRILGNSRYSDQALRKLFHSKYNQPLNWKILQADLERLVENYRNNGYSLMKIKHIDWRDEQGLLTLTLDEGLISDMRITGNMKTRNYVIMREFSAQKGRVFNWKIVRQAIRNVYASQLYDRVSADILEEKGENILQIKVKEKPSRILRLGAKYDTDRRAQVYLEAGNESLMGTGIKTLLQFRAGARDNYMGLKIRDDRIFTTFLTFNLQAYQQTQINPFRGWDGTDGRYREVRRGFRFQAGQQMKHLGQVVFELRQEYIRDRAVEGNFNYKQTIDLRTFAIRAITDKRDYTDFPTKGLYNHWAWESGNRLVLETKESYTKALVNLEAYYTFRRQHTWHLKFFAGIGDKSMPFSENFRLGGLHNFYGLHENEYFGRQLVLASLGYRYKLPWTLFKKNYLIKNSYFSLRYDLAGIWQDPELVFSNKDFFSGYGAYLGIQTTLGPLYLAYGRTGSGRQTFYFSLGLSY